MSFAKPIGTLKWLLGGLAILLLVVFQNCAGSFKASISPIQLDSSSLGGAPADPETSSKISDCKIPDQANNLLSQTCLGKYISRLNSGVRFDNFIEFEPQYPLYSDGANKRRWIYFPPGTQVNSADMDNWKFPKGTIVYKQFSLDGKLIETRQIEKVGQGDGFSNWRFTAYANLADDSDGKPTSDTFNEQNDSDFKNFAAFGFKNRYVVGTPGRCIACHGSAADVVRGFSYLQLSDSAKAFNLNTTVERGLLSQVPLKMDEIPGSALDKAVIGYIQGNCAMCHDGGTGGGNGNFRHVSSSVELATENLVIRASKSTGLITSGHPESSRLFQRLNLGTMPPLEHHKTVNFPFVSKVGDWISQFEWPTSLGAVGTPVITSFQLVEPANPAVSISLSKLKFSWAVSNAATVKLIADSNVPSLASTTAISNTAVGAEVQNLCYFSRYKPYQGQTISSFDFTLQIQNSNGEKANSKITVNCITTAPDVAFAQPLVANFMYYAQPNQNVPITWDVTNAAFTQVKVTSWSDDLMTQVIDTSESVNLVGTQLYDKKVPANAKYMRVEFHAENAAGKEAFVTSVDVPIGPIRFAVKPAAVVWINKANGQTFEIPARIGGGSSNNSPYYCTDDTNLIIAHGGVSQSSLYVVCWWESGAIRERDYRLELYDGGGSNHKSGTQMENQIVRVVNGCPQPQRVRVNSTSGLNECYTP